MPNIYISHGYADRNDYLESLAYEYDVNMKIVAAAADALGPNEDFDGLVAALEEYTR